MKIGMLFPGYGSQFAGMSKELYDESRIVQEYFEEASNCLNINFVKLCFASSDVELARMSNAYTSIFLVSSSIYALLKEEGIEPDIVAGYNQGEYSALFAAGGFTFPDGLYLLNKYASCYQDALENLEVAVVHITGVPTKAVEDFCFKASKGEIRAQIAIYKGATDNVVAGSANAVEYVRDWVTEQYPDAEIEDLGVEVGLHSDLMDEVVKSFTIYLEKVDFKDLHVPLLSGADAQVIERSDEVKYHVINLVNNPIVWARVMDRLAEYDLLVEIGPGTTLSDMVKTAYPDKLTMSINKRADIDALKKIVKPETEKEESSQAED